MELTWTHTPEDETRVPTWTAIVDHGMRDEKGRAVGAVATIYDYGTSAAIARFQLRVYAGRDGEKYGAIPPSASFTTLASAQAAAPAKIEKQRKAYAKKYAVKP